MTWCGSAASKVRELKTRLQLWELGEIGTLLERVERARNAELETRARAVPPPAGSARVGQGKKARKLTAKKRYRKAMMAFSAKVVGGTAEERAGWAQQLIFRSAAAAADVPPHPPGEASAWALANHSGGRSDGEMYKFLATQREEGRMPLIPIPHFPALSQPGPSGERPEHLDKCLACQHVGFRRRLMRALDVLTVRAARGRLPTCSRWLLNTSVIFLRKGGEEEDDDEDKQWLRMLFEEGSCEEGPIQEEVVEAASHADVTNIDARDAWQDAMSGDDSSDVEIAPAAGDEAEVSDGGKPPVRPIQMGELVRKFVCRRILKATQGQGNAACLGARHWGTARLGAQRLSPIIIRPWSSCFSTARSLAP
jgi:hypothetical protein